MLYFAPINLFSNYVYRHLLLNHGADFVFSEFIMIRDLDKAIQQDKIKIIEEDIPRTIFQIGVQSEEELDKGVAFILDNVKGVKEINLNMGCPQSTMQKEKICGGILHDVELMGRLCRALSKYGVVGSCKIRIGISIDKIKVKDYLETIQKNGIKKVYIHARPLRYGYKRPCVPEYVRELPKEFPDMELIYNGDIDSPQACVKEYKDQLIGRAALSNPFLFEDIKQEKKYKDGPYDPVVKDIHLDRAGKTKLKQEKSDIINEFLDLTIKHDLRRHLVINNMAYLCKGITNYKKLVSKIKKTKTNDEIKKVFNEWLGQ